MFQIQTLLAGLDHCPCGKPHTCPIQFIEIGEGALNALPELCKSYRSILLVADQNTYAVCGQAVEHLLQQAITSKVVFQSGSSYLIPNEDAIAQLEAALLPETDLLLGVGSGVINDLCKYVSYFHQLPYYIFATAPSMDGYGSTGAAMILKGMKETVPTRPPLAIIADTHILKNAPFEMLQAGYGDIVGKYSCLNDWKLSALVRDEYFCQTVYDIILEQTDRVRQLASGIADREEFAIGALMEAIVIVGIAMCYVGNSRPASGSEHHLSHFFEITGIRDGTPYLAHGIDVIHSAVETARLRDRLCSMQPCAVPFEREQWEARIRQIYSSSAEEVLRLQDKMGWYDMDQSATITEIWPEIQALLQEAPGEQEMLEIVSAIGLDHGRFTEFYGSEKIRTALQYAKDLKDRYSVLWLAYQYFPSNSQP